MGCVAVRVQENSTVGGRPGLLNIIEDLNQDLVNRFAFVPPFLGITIIQSDDPLLKVYLVPREAMDFTSSHSCEIQHL